MGIKYTSLLFITHSSFVELSAFEVRSFIRVTQRKYGGAVSLRTASQYVRIHLTETHLRGEIIPFHLSLLMSISLEIVSFSIHMTIKGCVMVNIG